MFKTTLYYVILLLSFCCGNIFGQSLQYENQIIENIDIEMMTLGPGTSLDNSNVTSRIKTRKGDIFSQIDFDNDLKTLANEFDRVEPTLNMIEGKLYITLKIWPKPTIRSISWSGNHKIKTSRLEKELGIAACAIFDRQAFNTAFHKLKAYYVKKGFFEASLDYKVELDPVANEVDIEVCIKEGRAGRIKKIIFDGFTCEEEEALLETMVTKKYFFLTSWVTDEGTYNEEAVQQDRFTVLSYLQNEGYADASVDIEVCEAKQKNRIVIRIIADKGEVYSFGKISIAGNVLFTTDNLLARFPFEEGDAFSPEAIRNTIKGITEMYGRRGYIDAIVDYETRLDCDGRSYSIHFNVEEGEKFCVGLIKVFGNCSTQTNVILHEVLLTPGEVFNITKLQLTEEKLKNIGYFKNVNVYAVKSDGPGGLGAHYRDVHIEVEETITGNFGAGFGYSSVESLFGELKITERNFNYKGLSRLFSQGPSALRGGGEFVSLSAMIGTRSRKYGFSWTKPFFRDTKWIVGFDLERSSNRYISKDYDIEATGGTIHGAYPLNPFLRVGVHYRLRNTFVRLSEHSSSSSSKKDHEHEDTQDPIKKLSSSSKKHDGSKSKSSKSSSSDSSEEVQAHTKGLISAAGTSLSYDSTDHPAAPTRGFKSRLEGEFAGLGGDHMFISLAYLNSYYIKAGQKGVIKLRADTRFILPIFGSTWEGIPLDERLFLGGDNTVRGYRSYKIGPQFEKTGDPKGGMSMQMLTLEYNRYLFKRLDGFLFLDAGHLSDKFFNFGKLFYSVGFGVKIRAMDSIPPIVLGMGFPLNPDSRGDVKKFFFTLGGRF